MRDDNLTDYQREAICTFERDINDSLQFAGMCSNYVSPKNWDSYLTAFSDDLKCVEDSGLIELMHAIEKELMSRDI